MSLLAVLHDIVAGAVLGAATTVAVVCLVCLVCALARAACALARRVCG